MNMKDWHQELKSDGITDCSMTMGTIMELAGGLHCLEDYYK